MRNFITLTSVFDAGSQCNLLVVVFFIFILIILGFMYLKYEPKIRDLSEKID